MKKELENREDIKRLVNRFYEKVKKDEHISHLFSHLTEDRWEKHLPVMYDFWENILFYTGSYAGNPMTLHQHLHGKFTLTRDHFSHWLKLFYETVDEFFIGEKADLAKQRAFSIATVMQIKILTEGSSENVY